MSPVDISRAGMVEKIDRSEAKPSASAPNDPRLREAARQFEAVFLRVMLSSLERTTKIGSGSSISAGQSTYGSMVVDALSDALSASGGIGLQQALLQGLQQESSKR
jgi:Rod binding domain-containing protein